MIWRVSPNYLSQTLSGPNVSEDTNVMLLPKRELFFGICPKLFEKGISSLFSRKKNLKSSNITLAVTLNFWLKVGKNAEIFNVTFFFVVRTLNIEKRLKLSYSRHWARSFILIGIHSMQDWTVTVRHGDTRIRSTKRLKYTGNMFRKNLQLKSVW